MDYSSCRFRIRRKCYEAQLRLCLRLRLASVMKYTFQPFFSGPFTTRINCSDFSCSLYVCTKFTCISFACMVGNYMYPHAATNSVRLSQIILAKVSQKLVAVNVCIALGRGLIFCFFFAKISKLDLVPFFTVAISFQFT